MRIAKKDGGFRLVLDMNEMAAYRLVNKNSVVEVNIDTLCRNPRKGRLPSPGKSYSLVNQGASCKLLIELDREDVSVSSFKLKNPARFVVDGKPGKSAQKQPLPSSLKAREPILTPEPETTSSEGSQLVKNHGLLPLKKMPRVVQSVNVRLTPQDIPLRQLLSSRVFYFDISPTWKPLEGGYVELVLSHSELLNPRVSNVTVEINGVPMRSIPLDKQNLWKGHISIPLDPGALRPGTNEIKLTALTRTFEERCSDIDSPGNWYRLHKESLVHLRYIQKEALKLEDFPSPYFETNHYRVDNTVLVLPDQATPQELSAAYALLLQWSLDAPGKDIQVGVRHFGEISSSLAHRMNLIYIGRRDAFPEDFMRVFGVPENLSGEVYYKTFLNDLGLGRMCVTGSTAQDVLFGVRSLLAREIRKQMPFSKAFLALDTPLPQKKSSKEMGTDIPLDRLFLPDIVMRGISLHHEENFSFRIPPQWDVYGHPKLVLLFRHSPNLDKVKSTLEVDINEVPQRGTSLTPENAAEGILTVPLEKEAVKKDYVNVCLRGYLDINVPDCSRFYTESAWMVVDKKSYFHLPHRVRRLKPLLENLPHAFLDPNLNIYMDPGVGGEELSALGRVLQRWQAQMFLPLSVEVFSLPKNVDSFSEGNRLIFAPMNKLTGRGLDLSVGYDDSKKTLLSGTRVPVVAPFGEDAIFFQVISEKTGVTVVMSWANQAPREAFLTKMLLRRKLRGDTCLVSPAGEVVPFYLREEAEKTREEESSILSWSNILDSLRGSKRSLGIFSFVVLLIMSVIVFSLFRSFRKR
ncbi:MAG: hypothetical protein CSA35_06600 [Dethiosulfovibrio peptidovorans]|nr:MAG: hypothetical protein CSA35_06600 [Dethiosulfovibrio peptidovorans]